MNDIGFGILCFGEDFYFDGAREKMKNIIDKGFSCYVLTDNRSKFIFDFKSTDILLYDRACKSYYDKMLLPKHILKFHDICILIDADTHITDYSFLNDLKTYKFEKGISYVDVLLNHPERKQIVKELDMNSREWKYFHDKALSMDSTFVWYELMWEYFLVINNDGFNQKEFFKPYETLQIAKEYGDSFSNKEVNGNGEGIAISIAAKVSGTPCQRDLTLYLLVGDKMESVSRRFMRNDNK